MSLKHEVITHWEENLKRVRRKIFPDISAGSCAYCQEYADLDCEGCPVKTATGEDSCRSTPYSRVARAKARFCLSVPPIRDRTPPSWAELTAAVEDELKFLRSLPEDREE